MAEFASPKLDFKMLILPAILLLSRNIDMKNPDLIQKLQVGLITVAVAILSIHFYVYSRVSASKDTKKIYVPPKPKPQLPFGLGPPEEPLKPEDYEETTYPEYEWKLLKESVGSVAMSIGISLVMSYKFQIHMSLMVQSIMLPLNLFDSPVMKKYLLGSTTSSTGGRLYNELDSKPTIQSLAPAVTAAEVPRVEELPDEPTADAAAATSKTSLANDK